MEITAIIGRIEEYKDCLEQLKGFPITKDNVQIGTITSYTKRKDGYVEVQIEVPQFSIKEFQQLALKSVSIGWKPKEARHGKKE